MITYYSHIIKKNEINTTLSNNNKVFIFLKNIAKRKNNYMMKKFYFCNIHFMKKYN